VKKAASRRPFDHQPRIFDSTLSVAPFALLLFRVVGYSLAAWANDVNGNLDMGEADAVNLHRPANRFPRARSLPFSPAAVDCQSFRP